MNLDWHSVSLYSQHVMPVVRGTMLVAMFPAKISPPIRTAIATHQLSSKNGNHNILISLKTKIADRSYR
jgi:hypothetical protein